MLAFDHVTSFVHDRHRAANELRGLGLHAVEGGVHTGFGSANDLAYFGLFYLELLAITDPVEAAGSGSEVCRYAVDFLESGEGLATLAFETDDLDSDVARLRAAGYTVAEPILMQRVHDDGFVSHSRIAYPSNPALPIRPPIVIERSIGPDERLPQLAERGIVAAHPAGNLTVSYVAVVVPDAVAAARMLSEHYGVPADDDLTSAPALGGSSCTVHLDRAQLVFVEPDRPGDARDRWEARGAGPFGVGVALGGVSDERWARLADRTREMDAAGIRFIAQPAEVTA